MSAAPFLCSVPLRFCDADALGHVNNSIYSVLCEAGRVEMLASAGMLVAGPDLAVVIARLELDFLREMNWPGSVLIESAVHRIGRKSFHMRQRLSLGGVQTARAASVLAVINTVSRRAVELGPEWHAALGPWLVPDFS